MRFRHRKIGPTVVAMVLSLLRGRARPRVRERGRPPQPARPVLAGALPGAEQLRRGARKPEDQKGDRRHAAHARPAHHLPAADPCAPDGRELSGEYSGIGIQLTFDGDRRSSIEGTPSYRPASARRPHRRSTASRWRRTSRTTTCSRSCAAGEHGAGDDRARGRGRAAGVRHRARRSRSRASLQLHDLLAWATCIICFAQTIDELSRRSRS